MSKELTYRTSRDNKSRIKNVLLFLIPAVLLFLISDLSGLNLIPESGVSYVSGIFSLLLIPVILLKLYEYRHTKRLIIDKECISHVQRGPRWFLPWESLSSISYEFSIIKHRTGILNQEYLRINGRIYKQWFLSHTKERKTYFLDLTDFYPTEKNDGKYNADLDACLSYYCRQRGITYDFFYEGKRRKNESTDKEA